MALFGGKDSCRIFEKHMVCPHCKHEGAYYTGCEALENLTDSPVTETEVERFYVCANPQCGFEWSVIF